MDNNITDQSDELELLRELSIQDFLDVGLDQVAYIKYIKGDLKTRSSYSIHAADGSKISVMDSYDTALTAIRINDLFPVTVH